MTIDVTKLTDVNLLRTVAGDTSGNDCHISLAKAYALGHSPMRTQMFLIRLKDIPQFVASQLVRHKVGAEWWMKSKRTDRGGRDFQKECSELHTMLEDMAKEVVDIADTEDSVMESYYNGDFKAMLKDLSALSERVEFMSNKFDRNAPTDLTGVLNAQAIVNISRDRLCAAASQETREIWQGVVNNIALCDEDLAKHCVRPCVATGICREKKCKYIHTGLYRKEREVYKRLFV